MKELAEVKKQLQDRNDQRSGNDNPIISNEISAAGTVEDLRTEIDSRLVATNVNQSNYPLGPCPAVKSPSDITMYVPAVKRASDSQYQGVLKNLKQYQITQQGNSKEINKQVPKFNDIDSMLLETRAEVEKTERAVPRRRLDFDEGETDRRRDDPMEAIREETRNRIVEAERHKASVEAPKGIDTTIVTQDDDDLMHVSCNVEDNLVDKAETGKFVEMDKYLNKPDETGEYGDEQRMTLVNRGGISVWEPVNTRKQKITNVHSWEKAFRVYMAIYTRVNPSKAAEMVQYIHTIHHAATKYSWENVAHYDRVFRKWMEKNPNRSWGKILLQMWSMCLTEPLPKIHSSGGSYNNKKDSKTCWKFNKGFCNYPQCKFPHRCTYCGSTSHGANACTKKQRKSDKKSDQQSCSNGDNKNNQGTSSTSSSNHSNNNQRNNVAQN